MSNCVKQKALSLIDREQLLQKGDRVLVAFSGGADSTVLLHLLLSLQEELSLGEIAAAHLNHSLRGEESDRDEAAVRRFCDRFGVRLFVERADVAAESKRRKTGLEEAGRAVRYEFLQRIATENGFARVATAHTVSDAMETVLLHLTRGTGMSGLAGIPPKRGAIIRPLLDCTRAEIEAYCAEHDLTFVTDSTNVDVTYARNRVRNCVVPHLYTINPRTDEAFSRFMRAAREDEAYWREQTAAALQKANVSSGVYRADELAALPSALRTRALRQTVRDYAAVELEEAAVRRLEELLTSSGSFVANGGVTLSVKQGYFTIEHGSTVLFEEQLLVPDMTYTIGNTTYRCEVLDTETFEKRKKVHKKLLQSACDYDKIQGAAHIRTRKQGDEYHPFRRGGGKTLKKWMNECRVPACRRDQLPIVTDDEGVLLVGTLGCDNRVAIDEQTRRILVIIEFE